MPDTPHTDSAVPTDDATGDVMDALRRDLQDGDDLALAMRLVADALDRRLDRVQRSLDDAVRLDAAEADDVAHRLQGQIELHRSSLDRHRSRLEDAVRDVQDVLDGAARQLDA